MTLRSLTELVLSELSDLYDAEHQLLKALPLIAEKTFSPELEDLLQEHAGQTREHIKRLDQVFGYFKSPASRKACMAMRELLAEAQELLKQEPSNAPEVLDAALICAVQKVEHYEIAGYSCVRTFAGLLGAAEVEELLQETLNEEELTDARLAQIAEDSVNLESTESEEEMLEEVKANQ